LTSEELAELRQFKQSDKLIGVNALLTHRKGVDILIRALPALDGYKLFIVGSGKAAGRLEELAGRLNVRGRCHFAGYRLNAYCYLPHYDIFALPSRSEGFPLSLLEAAFYKRPTVASNLPVIVESYDSRSLSIFDLKRPESIVDAIRNATNNAEMGENLFRKYKECYSPKKMYQRHLLIYEGKF
jgi:glycosyltransferase involved in cell wall biosynthesis